MSEYKYSTLAVHAGQYPDPQTGAVNVPIYLSSTFELNGIASDKGWDYSRGGNPTRDRLEEALAALEGGTNARVFGSGMGADSRRPLGLCVAGGLLFSQLLTLYITPVIYVYLDQLGTWITNLGGSKGRPSHVPAE